MSEFEDRMESANENDANESGWWDAGLTRREAGKRVAALGAGAALLGTFGVTLGACGGDDVSEADLEEVAADAKDAIDIQKADGWNVGADNASLKFKNASPTDMAGSLDAWKAYTDPAKLRAAWGPTAASLEKFASTELINSLGEKSLGSSIQPVTSKSMDEAYSRGLGMRALLEETAEPGATAVMVDLPGPEAVAFSAALADYANIVPVLDNWPHPNGAVPSHETLGAMLYYADHVTEQKAKVGDKAPTVFLMDANRLVDYRDDGNVFDNRYMATVPTAANLKSEGIATVLYAAPDDKRQHELADLYDPFVEYRENDVAVTMMPLTEFRPASAEEIAEHGEIEEGGSGYRRTYYYGGHPYFMPLFFSYYGMSSARRYGGNYRTPRRGLSRPSYSPTKRSTMFSSSTTGGRSGVGRQKGSGFGRVSTRTVNGKTSYSSASSSRSRSSASGRSSSGRSGSYGRSGGRSSSG